MTLNAARASDAPPTQHVELGGGCGHTSIVCEQEAEHHWHSVPETHSHWVYKKQHNKLYNIKKEQRVEVHGATGTTCKTCLSNNYTFWGYGVKTTAKHDAWDTNRHRHTCAQSSPTTKWFTETSALLWRGFWIKVWIRGGFSHTQFQEAELVLLLYTLLKRPVEYQCFIVRIVNITSTYRSSWCSHTCLIFEFNLTFDKLSTSNSAVVKFCFSVHQLTVMQWQRVQINTEWNNIQSKHHHNKTMWFKIY